MFYLLYNSFLRLLRPCYLLAALLLPAARRFQASRRTGAERLERFLEGHAGDAVLWLHAASVGELDQALALAREIRARTSQASGPRPRLIASVFSLSVTKTELPEFDLVFYLPLDWPGRWRKILDSMRPQVFVTMTWDVWPNLLRELSRRKVPSFLCSAALAEDSPRLRGWRRRLLQPVYACLTGIGAVDEDNRARFLKLLPDPGRVLVTGDTRFDTILHKIEHTRLDSATRENLERLKGEASLWIHASTYAADDRELFAVLPDLLDSFRDWRVFVFPHHIDEERLRAVEAAAGAAGLSIARYSQLSAHAGEASNDDGQTGAETPRCVLVDRMGILALAYRHGDFCYVGGGFHHRIHNTAEPAALGLPILTGPRIDTSPIALELERAGALRRLHSAAEIATAARQWMTNDTERKSTGRIGHDLVHERAGGARAFYDAFLKNLPD